ncbi:MAG: peptidyl-alpha-hydroxyglycine alpha-amidating lyase family protein [Chloroflexota bacterium]
MIKPGTLRYEVVTGWEQLPAGFTHRDVVGIGVDSRDRVYVLTRMQPRVIVYERDGTFVGTIGEGVFTERTHGLTIGPDDAIYCVDDGDHTVRKFMPDGKLVMTIGTAGVSSDTGYVRESGVASIKRGGPPFNRPTGLAVAPNGDLYVSDGYGNARVHRFSASGKLLCSWGEPGTDSGQFHLPHGIWVAKDGRVFVCDRENDRIQIFTPEGEYVDEWTQVQRPTDVFMDREGLVYVSELWWRPGQRSFTHGVIEKDQYGRVSVFDPEGTLVVRWGGAPPCAPGNLCAPHTLCVDSHGDLYVGEVTYTFAGKEGAVPEDCHTLQKFQARRSDE